MGDYNGIGPEVAIKSLDKLNIESSIPVWIGIPRVFETVRNRIGLGKPDRIIQDINEAEPGRINILEIEQDQNYDSDIEYGTVTADAGRVSMIAIDKGIDLCVRGAANAMVTAPISKEAIHKAGYRVPGHTEFLMEKTKSKNGLMILTGNELKIALSTIHIPVYKVSAELSFKKLVQQLKIVNQSLQQDFGIDNPSIALLGLNPHAGDGGVIGFEEIEIITPAIKNAVKQGIDASGPFPADGYFASKQYKNVDITVAMYHDQGLIPFKMLSFGAGVNFTAGLPIIRTSPDHGTAYDIAGRYSADESSFMAAYQLAVKMTLNRKK